MEPIPKVGKFRSTVDSGRGLAGVRVPPEITGG